MDCRWLQMRVKLWHEKGTHIATAGIIFAQENALEILEAYLNNVSQCFACFVQACFVIHPAT